MASSGRPRLARLTASSILPFTGRFAVLSIRFTGLYFDRPRANPAVVDSFTRFKDLPTSPMPVTPTDTSFVIYTPPRSSEVAGASLKILPNLQTENWSDLCRHSSRNVNTRRININGKVRFDLISEEKPILLDIVLICTYLVFYLLSNKE
jgi:hypothetical protein